MESAAIVSVIVFLGCYAVSLFYLNTRVRLKAENGSVDGSYEHRFSETDDSLKEGVSAVGIFILTLLGLMILIGLFCAYAFRFDPGLLE